MLWFPYFTHILALFSAFFLLHRYQDNFKHPYGPFCFANMSYIVLVLTVSVNLWFFLNFTEAVLRTDGNIRNGWIFYHGFDGLLMAGIHFWIGGEMQKKTGKRFWTS